MVADLDSIAPGPGADGVIWTLPQSGDLNANLVSLSPSATMSEHRNTVVDVLIVVLAGDGTLTVGDQESALGGHSAALVPRGSSRSIQAGSRGLRYLTVHLARPPLGLRSNPRRGTEQ